MSEIFEKIEQRNKRFSESNRYDFAEIFNIEKGDIVAFTGGGGKTSLIFKLAEELKGKGRICITTTTKMSIPEKSQYENLIIKNWESVKDSEISKELKKENRELDLEGEANIIPKFPEKSDKIVFKGEIAGIDFYATGIDYKKDKITGESREIDFNYLKGIYDYIFIEADGSRGRSLKFWKEDEPCIPTSATKVVALFNIKSLGKKVGDGVLRAEKFCDDYNGKIGSDILKREKSRREISESDMSLKKLTLESIVDEKLVGEYLSEKKFFRISLLGDSEKNILTSEESKYLKSLKKLGYFIFINGIESLEEFNSALKISNTLSSSDIKKCFEEEEKGEPKELVVENSFRNEKILLGSILKNEIYPYQQFSAILMASGYSRRLGKNKLFIEHNGKNLLDISMEKIERTGFFEKRLVISQENLNSYVKNIKKKLEEKMGENSKVVINRSPEKGQSYSMKLGIEESEKLDRNLYENGREFYTQKMDYMFFPCDQPFINEDTILKLMKKHLMRKSCQITLPWVEGHGTSPVIFSDSLREKLLNVQGDIGGREIIKSCVRVERVEFEEEEEFHDIDIEDDLKLLKK